VRTAPGLFIAIFSVGLLTGQTAHPDNPLTALSGSIHSLTDRVAPTVVQIQVTGYGAAEDEHGTVAAQISRQVATGSGVILDPEGYIVTNAHVVQGAIRIEVSLLTGGTAKTRSVSGHVVGIDRESDLAVVHIEEKGLPVLPIGNSDRLQQGDLVFAVGSPNGLGNSVSMGVVSATGRAISEQNPILYIQTDASVNPGNSGGALVDTNGALVGINSFIVSRSGGNEGIGFAIPSNLVHHVYDQIKQKGSVSRGTVGLHLQRITSVMAGGLQLATDHGAIVADVDPESTAEAAGIKRRDVMLTVNGRAINEPREFIAGIARRQGGEKVTLGVLRGTDRLTIAVEVKEQAAPWDPLAALVASPEKNLVPRLGILCLEIDKQVAQLFPDLRRDYGVIIAARATEARQMIDLQPGDVIHALNNQPVALLSALKQMVQELPARAPVVLQIERDGRFQYVGFEIE